MSVCMLSFLGFDAMSTLAEDVKGGPKQVSRGMIAALGIIGVLFIVQSYLAALLVPSPGTLIVDGDPAGTAFYDTARVAAGPWLVTVTALATALAWGLANNMVAQVATSRLLYAMARDGQLPKFLAKVSVSRSVPVNGILLTAAISLGLGKHRRTLRSTQYLLADPNIVAWHRSQFNHRLVYYDSGADLATDSLCALIWALNIHRTLLMPYTAGEAEAILLGITERIPARVGPGNSAAVLPQLARSVRRAVGDLATAAF
jgi:Amino acid permease